MLNRETMSMRIAIVFGHQGLAQMFLRIEHRPLIETCIQEDLRCIADLKKIKSLQRPRRGKVDIVAETKILLAFGGMVCELQRIFIASLEVNIEMLVKASQSLGIV